MSRRLVAVVVVGAVLAIGGARASAAAAGQGPPPGVHGTLQLDVLSSPPEEVSGGEARVRVEVPSSVALDDVAVTLDGQCSARAGAT
ncbi:MAG TPA: hypothetical protein VIU44_07185 [Gaiellaceae bacterium]